MSNTFNPKIAFREAREAEKAGKKKAASAGYSSLAIYLRRRGRAKDAKAMIERAISLSPDSPRLYLQLALCEAALGDEGAAKRATSLFTKHTIRKHKVEEYTPYLEQHLREHAPLKQIFYEALLQIDRTDATPFLKLASALSEQNKWGEAKQAILHAFKTKTHEKTVIARLKECLERVEDKDALDHVTHYQQGRIARNDLLELLAGQKKPKLLAEKRKRPREEEKNLQTLIEELEQEMGIDLKDSHDSINPLIREFRRKSENITAGDSKAQIDMALAFYEMGLYEDARDELRPILVSDPKYLEAQMLLGEIHYSERSDLGALEVFNQILRDERLTTEIFLEAKYKLTLIYFRLGDLRQALSQARELEKKAPGYRDTQRLFLQIQEALGDGLTNASANAANASGASEKRVARRSTRKKAS